MAPPDLPSAALTGFPSGAASLARVVRGTGPRLVLVHGFTQNAGAWGPFAADLARRHQVVAVDLPGHGGSSGVHGGLWDAARLVGDTAGAADYVGYSLGGRVCLHLALARPDLVRSLVLIGASPGLTDEGDRTARRLADEDLAAGLDDSQLGAGGDGDKLERQAERLDAFLARWLAGPLFTTLSPEAAMVEARRRNTCAGLASSLRECGTGTQEPLWDRLAELRMPVLLLAGQRDRKFATLAGQMARAIGATARLELVSGAGHACHLERPGPVAASVSSFVESHP